MKHSKSCIVSLVDPESDQRTSMFLFWIEHGVSLLFWKRCEFSHPAVNKFELDDNFYPSFIDTCDSDKILLVDSKGTSIIFIVSLLSLIKIALISLQIQNEIVSCAFTSPIKRTYNLFFAEKDKLNDSLLIMLYTITFEDFHHKNPIFLLKMILREEHVFSPYSDLLQFEVTSNALLFLPLGSSSILHLVTNFDQDEPIHSVLSHPSSILWATFLQENLIFLNLRDGSSWIWYLHIHSQQWRLCSVLNPLIKLQNPTTQLNIPIWSLFFFNIKDEGKSTELILARIEPGAPLRSSFWSIHFYYISQVLQVDSVLLYIQELDFLRSLPFVDTDIGILMTKPINTWTVVHQLDSWNFLIFKLPDYDAIKNSNALVTISSSLISYTEDSLEALSYFCSISFIKGNTGLLYGFSFLCSESQFAYKIYTTVPEKKWYLAFKFDNINSILLSFATLRHQHIMWAISTNLIRIVDLKSFKLKKTCPIGVTLSKLIQIEGYPQDDRVLVLDNESKFLYIFEYNNPTNDINLLSKSMLVSASNYLLSPPISFSMYPFPSATCIKEYLSPGVSELILTTVLFSPNTLKFFFLYDADKIKMYQFNATCTDLKGLDITSALTETFALTPLTLISIINKTSIIVWKFDFFQPGGGFIGTVIDLPARTIAVFFKNQHRFVKLLCDHFSTNLPPDDRFTAEVLPDSKIVLLDDEHAYTYNLSEYAHLYDLASSQFIYGFSETDIVASIIDAKLVLSRMKSETIPIDSISWSITEILGWYFFFFSFRDYVSLFLQTLLEIHSFFPLPIVAISSTIQSRSTTVGVSSDYDALFGSDTTYIGDDNDDNGGYLNYIQNDENFIRENKIEMEWICSDLKAWISVCEQIQARLSVPLDEEGKFYLAWASAQCIFNKQLIKEDRFSSFTPLLVGKKSSGSDFFLTLLIELVGFKFTWQAYQDCQLVQLYPNKSTSGWREEAFLLGKHLFSIGGNDPSVPLINLLFVTAKKTKLLATLWKKFEKNTGPSMKLCKLYNEFESESGDFKPEDRSQDNKIASHGSNLSRIREIALKNAFSCMSKHDHAFAAAFFILGNDYEAAYKSANRISPTLGMLVGNALGLEVNASQVSIESILFENIYSTLYEFSNKSVSLYKIPMILKLLSLNQLTKFSHWFKNWVFTFEPTLHDEVISLLSQAATTADKCKVPLQALLYVTNGSPEQLLAFFLNTLT